jgi:hypothetical protein
MDSVAGVVLDVLFTIVAFAFIYPFVFIGLFLLLLVGAVIGVIRIGRYRNRQEQIRQTPAPRVPPVRGAYAADAAAFSSGGLEWPWLGLGITAVVGLWMSWLFLPGWLIPGTPAAGLILYAQNRVGYWFLRLAPIAAVVFLIREGAQNRQAGRVGEWIKRLVGTACLGLAVHVLLCLGSIPLGFTPLVRFLLPPPGGGHDYGAMFAPLTNALAWPFYMWLLLAPLSVAITAVIRTASRGRRTWPGPAGNLVLAATLALLLPTWLVTGGYAKGVDARDERGLTALMAAAGTGHLPGVRALIGAGADVNARSRAYGLYKGATALELALGHPEIVLTLLESGARPDSYELLSAVNDKNDTLVEALLRAGADVQTRDSGGQTALMIAAEKSRTDPKAAGIVQRLIAAGSDVNARDQLGQTALMMGGPEEVTRALLAAGADPTLTDKQGVTTLQRYRIDGTSAALLRQAIERTGPAGQRRN